MDFLLDALTEWLKEMLVGGIMGNLSGMFDSVNQQVGDISVQVGQTPQGWNGGIFNMIQNLSNSIMVPIAGVILAIVMTLELIQMITDKNNLHDFQVGVQVSRSHTPCHEYMEYRHGRVRYGAERGGTGIRDHFFGCRH